MHNPESVLENDRHKHPWEFEIQTDHVILSRQLELVIVQKKKKSRKENLPNSGFCCSGLPRSKIERK